VRWLEDEELESLSPYLLSSEARTLAEEILPDLRYAGVRVPFGTTKGAAYWEDFNDLVNEALAALD
jgi:hypothetical protein